MSRRWGNHYPRRVRRQGRRRIIMTWPAEPSSPRLSMPHSPRVHGAGSGSGIVPAAANVALDTGRRTVVAELPGFARAWRLSFLCFVVSPRSVKAAPSETCHRREGINLQSASGAICAHGSRPVDAVPAASRRSSPWNAGGPPVPGDPEFPAGDYSGAFVIPPR